MSSFRQQTTNINDQGVLVDALKKMGYNPEINETAKNVRGHYNETRTAHVILKKEDLKQGGDIGFSRGQDGNYSIVTDTYVMKGFSLDKFKTEVMKGYTEAKVRKQARIANLTFVGKQPTANGGFKLVYTKA